MSSSVTLINIYLFLTSVMDLNVSFCLHIIISLLSQSPLQRDDTRGKREGTGSPLLAAHRPWYDGLHSLPPPGHMGAGERG